MNGSTAPLVSIVIVSYNTRPLLQRALASISSSGVPARIVVVDNGSHDGSVELVQDGFPAVHCIANTDNRGFAAGTNQGLREAEQYGTPWSLLLNPDAWLLPNALPTLIEFMHTHPRVACVAPRLIYPDGQPQAAAFRFPTLAMELFDQFPPRGPLLGRLQHSPANGRYREDGGIEPFQIDHPLGAAMLLRAAALRDVGLFDEGYWMYVEEVDWCKRARAAGWEIWQVPAATVVHVGGASSRQFRGRSLVELERSRLRFWAKFGARRSLRARKVIIRMGMIVATLRTWRAWQRTTIGRDELRERLATYGRITRLQSTIPLS